MIHLENINKYYRQGKERFHALHDMNLDVDRGEFVAIMGQSGSGKSTFINIIGFLDEEFEGTYIFDGINIGKTTRAQHAKIRNQNVGFVFQNFKLINNETVAQNVMVPLLYAGLTNTEARHKAEEVLGEVGLQGYGDQLPKNLSGGQQQRVSIARALVTRPKFLIADEPTGALDSRTSEEIMQLFRDLNKHGMTIVMVTHDPKVGHETNRIIHIMDGRIVSDNPVDHENGAVQGTEEPSTLSKSESTSSTSQVASESESQPVEDSKSALSEAPASTSAVSQSATSETAESEASESETLESLSTTLESESESLVRVGFEAAVSEEVPRMSFKESQAKLLADLDQSTSESIAASVQSQTNSAMLAAARAFSTSEEAQQSKASEAEVNQKADAPSETPASPNRHRTAAEAALAEQAAQKEETDA